MNQVRLTLERAELLIQSPYGLTVKKLSIDLPFGTTEHCNDLIKLCDSKDLIEVEQTIYSTAHVKSVTPLGKVVRVALETRIDEFEDRGQSIAAQLDRVIVAARQVQPNEQLERVPAIVPSGSPTRNMLRERES